MLFEKKTSELKSKTNFVRKHPFQLSFDHDKEDQATTQLASFVAVFRLGSPLPTNTLFFRGEGRTQRKNGCEGAYNTVGELKSMIEIRGEFFGL